MPDCTLPTQPNNKLYNGGSEWQKDFGDLPDYYNTYYRNYDPAIGRFISTDPLAEMSYTMTTYNYANNNPIAYNDPLGDRAFPNKPKSIEEGFGSSGGGGASGRIGPGSGNYWSDGIGYSDWSSFHGSQMYRDGLAAGLTDLGGTLYRIEADGTRPHLLVHNGVAGYWTGNNYSIWDDRSERDPSIVFNSTFHEVTNTGGGGSQPGFLEANWKDIAFMGNDLTQAYIGANTTLKTSSGYRLAQTTVQLPLGSATRTSTRALSTISKVGGGIAKAAPWFAGRAIVDDVVSNKQINAGNVYQGVVTGLSLIPGAGLVVGGGALALEGISYYYTGISVSDNINQSLNGGVIHNWK